MLERIEKIIEDNNCYKKNIFDFTTNNIINDDVNKVLNSSLSNEYFYNSFECKNKIENKYDTEIKDLCDKEIKKVFSFKYANSCVSNKKSFYKATMSSLVKVNDNILFIGFTEDDIVNYEKDYNTNIYELDKETEQINYDELRSLYNNKKFKLTFINSGFYSRKIDYQELYDIVKSNNGILVCDITDISGMISTKLISSLSNYFDLAICSTSGFLKGPYGYFIGSNNSNIFNNVNRLLEDKYECGECVNVLAAKLLSIHNSTLDNYKFYVKQLLKCTKVFSDILKMNGLKVISYGTDSYFTIVNVKSSFNITGTEARKKLEEIGIICDKILVPHDVTNSYITSGLRFSLLSLVSKGLNEKDFIKLAEIIVSRLKNENNINELKDKLKEIF